jgi:hypothetical protein
MATQTGISLKIDDSDWSEFHQDLYARNLDFATSLAINGTAYDTQQAVRKGMDIHYDGGPVSFTRSGILFTKSSKRNLHAMVYINPNRGDFIKTTIEGGMVTPLRGKTRVRPVKMRLTKQGNISNRYQAGQGGKVQRLLAKPKYFSGVPKGMPNTPNNQGVWERMGRGGKKALRMIAHYKRQWRQEGFFPAYAIADRTIRWRFVIRFRAAIKRATNGRIG